MKIGIISGWKIDDLKKSLKRGFTCVEWDYNVGNDPADLDKDKEMLKAFMDENGMTLSAIGRWGSDKYDKEGNIIEDELKNQKALIDLCAYFNCPVFMTGVNNVGKNFDEACDYAAKYLRLLVDYGKEKGVKVCCYNCDWNNIVREPKAWRKIFHEVPELGIKYDPSHCINSGSGDYLGEIDEFGDRFYHFHVKGTLNLKGCHIDDPPAGLDMINWRAVMGMLYARNYQAVLSVEPHSGIWRGPLGEWGIQYTKKFIEEMIAPE
jgi:sugar phosphate isomerase/epimerase